MRLVTILAGTAMLAACGSEDTATVTTEDGEAEYSVDRSSGEANIEFRGNDGESVNIRTGANLAAGLPRGFSVYRGAKVISSSQVSHNEGSGMNVMMESSASPEDMVEFYRGQAESAGFTIQMDMKTQDTHMISGKDDDERVFSFNASSGEDGTTGHLMIGENRRR
jgi:hypothetical protein